MKQLFLYSFLVLALSASAQDETDVLRYAMLNSGSTARGAAIGGAVGSIGGEFSSVVINPAALGKYSKGDFSMTAAFLSANTDATYLQGEINARQTRLGLQNFSFVSANRKEYKNRKQTDWKSTAFGLGFNRLASLSGNYTYSGINTSSSIVNRFAEEINSNGGLNNLPSSSILAQMAFDTYLIDSGMNDKNQAQSYVPYQGGLRQTKSVNQSGMVSEFNVGFGANYKDRLMLGLSLNFPLIAYRRDVVYSETDLSGNTDNDFQEMSFTESLATNGLGINLKLGAIYSPVKSVRLGIAYHTPSSYTMTDDYSYSMRSNTEQLLGPNGPILSATPTSGSFNYGMTTPGRFIYSGSVFFGKHGFFSADVEQVAYKSMSYDFKGYSGDLSTNNVIQTIYKNAFNVKFGAEMRVNQFNYRAGYAFYGSPFADPQRLGETNVLSFGFGYRGKTGFIDLCYQHNRQMFTEFPYVLNNNTVSMSAINQRKGNFVVTTGWLLKNRE